MKVLSTLALVGLSQAATGNFCQNQANYVPTAMAGHPGAAADSDACSAKMSKYESVSGVTDWITIVAGGAVCTTVFAGNAFSVHLDDKARNCCTDGKHVCDVGLGSLCKNQTTFSPAALAKDGSTCIAKELQYERDDLFNISSWTTVYAARSDWSCEMYPHKASHGNFSLKVHLDDQTAACCTSGGNVCAAPAPAPTTTGAPTTAAPTTTGARTTNAGAVSMGPTSTLGAFIVAAAVAMHR